MPWNNFTGKNFSDLQAGADIRGMHAPPEYLLRGNSFVDDLQKAAPALAKVLADRRNNEIANALNASNSAQRATPVLDSGGQMVSGGGGMDSSGVAAYNQALGLPGKYQTPDLGGTAGLYLQQAQQAADNKRQADAVEAAKQEQQGRLIESQITKNNAPEAPAAPSNLVPTLIGGKVYNLTPDKAADVWNRQHQSKGDSMQALNKDVQAATGASIGDIASGKNPGFGDWAPGTTPGGGGIQTNPDIFHVEVPNKDGTTRAIRIPRATYDQFRQRYNQIQNGGSTSSPDPAAQSSSPDPAADPNAQPGSDPNASDSGYDAAGSATLPQPEPRVKVIGPDGKLGTLPKSQVGAAMAQGYKLAEDDLVGDPDSQYA